MTRVDPAAPPSTRSGSRLAVLVSGGGDSAVLLAEAARGHAEVFPLYVRCGLFWERVEQLHLHRFLQVIGGPSLRPLHILDLPVQDVYEGHWSLTGAGIPKAGTPDEAVFLPGR